MPKGYANVIKLLNGRRSDYRRGDELTLAHSLPRSLQCTHFVLAATPILSTFEAKGEVVGTYKVPPDKREQRQFHPSGP